MLAQVKEIEFYRTDGSTDAHHPNKTLDLYLDIRNQLFDKKNDMRFWGGEVLHQFETTESQSRRGVLHGHGLVWLKIPLEKLDEGRTTCLIPDPKKSKRLYRKIESTH